MRRLPVERLRRLFEPADELSREVRPEAFEVLLGAPVDLVVLDDGLRAELLGGRERARFLEQGLDRGLGVLGLHTGRNMTDSKVTVRSANLHLVRVRVFLGVVLVLAALVAGGSSGAAPTKAAASATISVP